MPEDAIITIDRLTKRFGEVTAVDAISLQVKPGEIFGFLGPNGAGKSTTIKILITLLAPTEGEATVDGLSIRHQAAQVRRAIGYVPQLISVDGALTASENLLLMARLYDLPASEQKQRVGEVLSFLDLQPQANHLVKTFSGGMIRKLEIGQGILHRPHVLFLDEPTAGLDPIARRNVWSRLKELNAMGTTIFFSTHYMDEAEEVSDRVAIMDHGKIAACGPVPELIQKTGREQATLEDAFIYFTGATFSDGGSFRETKRSRATERRLG